MTHFNTNMNNTMSKRCETCNCDFVDEYAYQGHCLGKKHLSNLEKLQRTITVSGIPQSISPKVVAHFMQKFGEIIFFKTFKGGLLMEYKQKEPVQSLLKEKVYFDGILLKIKPKSPTNKKRPEKDKRPTQCEAINGSNDLKYSNIKSIFETTLTFDEQLEAFLDRVAVKDSEISTQYERTCIELNEIFRIIYPQCQTYRFGSTVTGLGFINCDLDIYLDTGFPRSQGNDRSGKSDDMYIFSDVKKLLYRTNVCSNIVPIPKARTPIIKFTYLPTNISCDISFKNNLGVHNSQLVKFCISMDYRLKPTMMVIKYWLSNFELQRGDKMSKYALTMLLLFYLQQPEVKLVPPIVDLKKNCVPDIVDGWQVSFNRNTTNFVKGPGKHKSIPELLHGFYEFYSKYNFNSNIICPIDGLSYERSLFNQPECLPESMDRYKEYLKNVSNPRIFQAKSIMCIQDPNQLNHNLTAGIGAKYLESFKMYCTIASEMCAKSVQNSQNQLLPSIFTIRIVQPKADKNKNVCFEIFANKLIKVGLPENYESLTDEKSKNVYIANNWCRVVTEIVEIFFEKVLKFKVNRNYSKRELKQQKIGNQSDVHSNDQKTDALHCTGETCIWRDRKISMNIIDPSISILEKEVCISERLFELVKSKPYFQNKQIDFEFLILKNLDAKPHLIFSLVNNNSSKGIFFEISQYVKSKLPYIINKTLAHMLQFGKKSPIE